MIVENTVLEPCCMGKNSVAWVKNSGWKTDSVILRCGVMTRRVICVDAQKMMASTMTELH